MPGSTHAWRILATTLNAVVFGAFALTAPASASDCCRIEMEHVVFEPFEADGKYGFRLKGGSFILIEPRYLFATTFTSEGIAAVVDEEGWAWIDRTATVLARPHVIDNGPDPFADGLTRIVEDGRYGFMDKRGGVVIPARYVYAEPFEGGYALVCADCRPVPDGEHSSIVGERWGAIDRSGAVVLAFGVTREEAARALSKDD